jgi:uncharacterized zinc-type alcohol dehydrogenase-like protein
MALKLAKGLGANVTLFTRSPDKEQDARRLGADNIVISTNEEQMAAVKGKFDLIIDTVPNTAFSISIWDKIGTVSKAG